MGSSILITKVIIIKMASNQLIQTKLELQKLAEEKEEMERQLTEVMEEKIQDMKVEVKSIGEYLEAMEDKIQDMKVEGIENIRFWIEESGKILEELKCSMDLDEKEDLKLRLLKFQDLAASIDKLAMADIPLNEIEQSLAKEQM